MSEHVEIGGGDPSLPKIRGTCHRCGRKWYGRVYHCPWCPPTARRRARQDRERRETGSYLYEVLVLMLCLLSLLLILYSAKKAEGAVMRVDPAEVVVLDRVNAEALCDLQGRGGPQNTVCGVGTSTIGQWTAWGVGERLYGMASIPRADFRPETHTLARWEHVDLTSSWPQCPLRAEDNGYAVAVYPASSSPHDYPQFTHEFRSRRTSSFGNASQWADSLAFVLPVQRNAVVVKLLVTSGDPDVVNRGPSALSGGLGSGHIRLTFWTCEGIADGFNAELLDMESFEAWVGSTLWWEQADHHAVHGYTEAVVTPVAFTAANLEAVVIDTVDGFAVRALEVASGAWLAGTTYERNCDNHIVWPASGLASDGHPTEPWFSMWLERVHLRPFCTLESLHLGDMEGPHPSGGEVAVWPEPMPADYLYSTEVLPEPSRLVLLTAGMALLWLLHRTRRRRRWDMESRSRLR